MIPTDSQQEVLEDLILDTRDWNKEQQSCGMHHVLHQTLWADKKQMNFRMHLMITKILMRGIDDKKLVPHRPRETYPES